MEVDEFAVATVDNCLWIHATRIATTDAMVFKRLAKLNADVGHLKLFPLQLGLDFQFALPLFLRSLPPAAIADILLGNIAVHLALDWRGYGKLVEKHGGSFGWSSEKIARKQTSLPKNQRSLFIDGRIPEIKVGKGGLLMGAPSYLRILFDGICPSIAAAQQVEMAGRAGELIGEGPFHSQLRMRTIEEL